MDGLSLLEYRIIGKADFLQLCGHLLEVVCNRGRGVGVGPEGDFPAAKLVVAGENPVGGIGLRHAVSKRAGVDLQGFSIGNQPLEDLIDSVRVFLIGKGALQGPIVLCRIAGDVIEMAQRIEVMEGLDILKHTVKVGIDRGFGAAAGIEFRIIGVQAVHLVDTADNEVEGTGVNSNVMGIVIQSLELTMATTPSEVLTGCYITGNEVHNLGRSAIHCGGWLRDEDINQNNGNQQLFRDFHFDGNHAYDTGCMGIYICASSDSSINRNIVHDTGIYKKNQLLEGVCGIMALCADHCEIAYNECYDIYDAKTTYDAMGIDIDWNTNAIDVHHNYCHDCMGSGIGTMANQNSAIRENRIIENRGETLHIAPITITNFTQYYAGVKDDMHAVKNLLIANNLVRNAHQVEAMMAVKGNNGSPAFEGDTAIGNHFVYEGDPNDLFFIEVDPSLPWYKFAENQYFSKDTSVYKNLETTEEDYINTEEGAEPYVLSKKKDFAAWQKRDLGASYGLFGASEKTKLSDLKVAYQEGKISASWADETASWRYAIFLTEAEKEATFPDLLDYSYEKSCSFSLERKGDYDLHIVPEDNEGNYGTPVQARLHLQ